MRRCRYVGRLSYPTLGYPAGEILATMNITENLGLAVSSAHALLFRSRPRSNRVVVPTIMLSATVLTLAAWQPQPLALSARQGAAASAVQMQMANGVKWTDLTSDARCAFPRSRQI